MTTPDPVRDYEALRRRWQDLTLPGLRRAHIADIDGYPVDRLDLPATAPRAPRLLLAAGTHGDEPAGPRAIADILHGGLERLAGRVDLVVLPCINPWGYVHDRRENADGDDVNRSFEDVSTETAARLTSLLADESFDLFLEFHEDWEYEGYYLFECRHPEHTALGPHIVDRVRALGPIYDRPEVDDVAVVGGVATATPQVIARHDIGMKPLPLWLFLSERATRSITCETPSTHWPLERRIAAHEAAFDVAVDNLLAPTREM